MADVAVEPSAKLGFSYERKVGLPNYASKTASAWLTVDLPAEADEAETVAKVESLARSVKLAVLAELGIEAELDEHGVVVETTPAPAVTLSVSEAAQKLEGSFAAPPTAAAPQAAAPSDDLGAIPADVQADIRANPSNYYDNRAQKASGQYKPTAADFKHKATSKSYWIKSKF